MDNPVLNDDTAGEALRALGAQADAAGGEASSATDQPDTRAAGAEETTTDETAAAPKVDGESPDNPEKKPDDQAQKEQPKQSDKEPSAYEKAKRTSEQREADAWKKIQARQAEQDKRQREQDERESKFQQPSKSSSVKDERGYSAADYQEAARNCYAEGNQEMGDIALHKAMELHKQEVASAHREQRQMSEQQFQQAVSADLEKLIQVEPDYGKQGSERFNEMVSFMQAEPYLLKMPNGYSKAAAVLNLQREAAQSGKNRERAEKAEREVERLTKLTSINGGGPSAPPAGQKSFDDMSDAEQRTFLEREATRADTYVG